MGASEFLDESDLHAFVDGELAPERRRKIADCLLRRPEDAALVEAWRRQNAALRVAFAQTAQEPLPISLHATTPKANTSRPSVNWARSSAPGKTTRSVRRLEDLRRSRRRYALASSIGTLLVGVIVAAVAILAFTGSASPPEDLGHTASPGFVGRADVAYLTFAKDPRAVEIGADKPVELAAWLAERAGFGRLPDLSRAGLRLIGGRLVPGAVGAAGFLLYETKRGDRVGLYFERAGASAAPTETPKAAPGLTAIEWRGVGMAFVLLGPLPNETMQAVAEGAASAVKESFAPGSSPGSPPQP